MPALLTSTSIDLKRDSAVSTILAAVAGSPMSPSTRATRSEAATSADWVNFCELATTLQPRSTNAFTTPAPMPCEAPVTTAVFRVLFMVVSLRYRAWPTSRPTHLLRRGGWTAKSINYPSPACSSGAPAVDEAPTTVIIQRYLDALPGDPAAEPVVRELL